MLLIARRYLLSQKSHSVVNIIAWVSIVSLLIPVAAVIILLSVFNGFEGMISQMESQIEGDLTLRLREGRNFAMSEVNSAGLRETEGVRELSFMTEQMMLIEHNDQSAVVTLRGVDENFAQTLPIEESVRYGAFDLSAGGVILGRAMVSKLGVRSLNDIELGLYALKTGRLQSYLPMGSYNSTKGRLSGVMILDQQSEERYAFAAQSTVNELIGSEGEATRLAIALDKGADIETIRERVESIVDAKFRVESRSELNPTLYQIIKYEKMGVLLICSFVMLLASFSLLGALTMLILEKNGDLVTLRAIGLNHNAIKRIFAMEGMLISSVAIAVGTVIGVSITLMQQHFGFVELPSSTLAVTAYPVELRLGDILSVVTIAIIISLSITMLVVRQMLGRALK